MERHSPKNNSDKLIANPPMIYRTAWQEIALVGKSLTGDTFVLKHNPSKKFWEQVIYDSKGNELKRAQITNCYTMTYHEICLFAPYCPGGEFYDRLKIVTNDDFVSEIE